ncbi:MAG: ATP-binding protein [Cyclobacteriaceae bacterium]
MIRRNFFALILFLIVCYIQAQPDQVHFSSEGIPAMDYLFGSEQIWDVIQDSTGMLIVATGALKEYDGKDVRVIQSDVVIRVLEKSESSRIYAGGVNDFGYLTKDSVGRTCFVSLTSKLSEASEPDKIEHILIKGGSIYFAGTNHIYQYEEETDQVVTYHTTARSYPLFKYEGSVYCIIDNQGIFELNDGSLRYYEDQPNYEGIGATSVISYESDSLVLFSSSFGALKFKAGKYSKMDVFGDDFLNKELLYSVEPLNSGNYAFCFLKGGLVITDERFQPIVRYDETNGFSNLVYGVREGLHNELWVCTNNGLFVLDLNSNIFFHNKLTGLEGLVTDILSIGDSLFVSTFNGVFTTLWSDTSDPLDRHSHRFSKVSGSGIYSYDLLQTPEGLLVNSYQNVGIIANDKYTVLATKMSSNGFVTFSPDSSRILATGDAGNELLVFTRKGKSWKLNNTIDTREFSSIFNVFKKIFWDDKLQKYWGSTSRNIFTLEFDSSFQQLVELELFDEEDGLPNAKGNTVVKLGEQIRFLTNFGLYKLDYDSTRFLKDLRFGELFDSNGFYLLNQEDENKYWYASRDGTQGMIYRPSNKESFRILSKPLNQFPPNQQIIVNSIHGALFGGFEGMGIVKNPLDVEFKIQVPTAIRSVEVFSNQGDSTVFWGSPKGDLIPKFSPSQNAFRFRYSLPYYLLKDRISYSYKLDGFETEWSPFIDKNEKEYTNLSSGKYTMRVRARNGFDEISEPGEYSFEILPSWYITVWAFASYFVLFIFIIWVVVKVNARRLKKENEKLEQTILERTQEIRYQAEKLQSLDNAKSRFFANISHELRTPLTLIQGPLESVLNGSLGKVSDTVKSNLDLSRSSTKKLLNLVEEILDLSKLEAGKLELKTEAVRFHDLVKRIFFTYQSSYSAKSIEFQFDYQLDEDAIFRVDIGKLEKILDNLMSNAVKFTEANGLIKMNVSGQKDKIEIKVSDTGVGIGQDELDQIFNRFYQAGKDTRYSGGTGIGLSLAKELATLMNGDLQVMSKLGEGTTFTLTIPMKVAVQEDLVLSTATNEKEIANLDESEAVEADPLNLKTAKILIVEDDDAMRGYIKAQLGSYSLDEAADGLLAIEKLEANRYDLVITDLMMPKLDGLDLVTHLRANESTRNISIIMLTARAADEDIVNALTMGVNDYMIKPFNPEELKARVVNVLTNRMAVVAEGQQPTSADEKLVEEMKVIVRGNMKNSAFNVATLAAEVALSERQLSRNIQKITGLSAGNFIREVRLNEARILLENRTYTTISEVAYAVGFEKPGYFSEIYSKRFGKKPSDYLQT